MKKLLIPFIFAAAVLFQSCTGPRGPEGPAGLDGPIGQTFEIENVNFNSSNSWRVGMNFSEAKVGLEDSDVVLIYILWEVTDTGAPVWRLLPQPIDMPRGVYYNFDFTRDDYTLQIEAPSTAILNSLSADFTQGQTFRIVALPSDWSNGRMSAQEQVDYSDYNAVKAHFHLDESKIQKISAQ
jgi:hypothetical protein